MQTTENTAAPLMVRGGRVNDAGHPEPQQIDLLLENGRIVAMGHELNVPADIAVLDAAGLDIFPGFVDAHTHIGLDGYGIGYEGYDYNEMNDIWTLAIPPLPMHGKQALPACAPGRAALMCWAVPLPPSRRWASVWTT